MVIGNTPVVRLKRVGAGRVFLKLESRSPNATYADRLALALCEQAGFPPGARVNEAGDPALCVALAAQCKQRDWSLSCWLSEDCSIEVRQALELWGATVHLTPFESGAPGARQAAIAQGPLLSETWPSVRFTVAHQVGRELGQTVRADGGRIDALVAGCSTGATLSGVMSELRASWPSVLGVAVQPEGAPVIDRGVWNRHRQSGQAAFCPPPMLDRTLVSRTIDVSDRDAWAMRGRLGREEGVLLSVASAAAVCGAEVVAREAPDAHVYALAVDTGERDFSLEAFFK